MQKSIHSSEYAQFLQVFRDVRTKSGLTQIDLAKKIGESQSFVSKCERGERRIDLAKLHAFCSACGISLNRFVRAFERVIDDASASETRRGAVSRRK